jgi:hypothetical protein
MSAQGTKSGSFHPNNTILLLLRPGFNCSCLCPRTPRHSVQDTSHDISPTTTRLIEDLAKPFNAPILYHESPNVVGAVCIESETSSAGIPHQFGLPKLLNTLFGPVSDSGAQSSLGLGHVPLIGPVAVSPAPELGRGSLDCRTAWMTVVGLVLGRLARAP